MNEQLNARLDASAALRGFVAGFFKVVEFALLTGILHFLADETERWLFEGAATAASIYLFFYIASYHSDFSDVIEIVLLQRMPRYVVIGLSWTFALICGGLIGWAVRIIAEVLRTGLAV